MHFLIAGLLVWTLLLVALLWACVAATWMYFRLSPQPPAPAELLPMTVIKPVRGLDETLLPGLEALVRADPGGRLQIVVSMESALDPACVACHDFAARHAERDISIAISGPAQGRMGKIHNMIAALPRAKYPRIVFSDADIVVTPRIVTETSLAFGQGFNAIYALPYHLKTDDISGYLMQIAFGHSFGLAAALAHYAALYNLYAGAWMAYTRDMLDKIGGLEPFSQVIADDYSIGAAADKAGSRKYILHARVGVQEGDRTLKESLRHLAKWSTIIHSCLPALYAILPLTDGMFIALLATALAVFSGWAVIASLTLLAVTAFSRIAVGVLQDLAFGDGFMRWHAYAGLPLADVFNVILWPFGFRSTIWWRGTRYRLSPGGTAQVLKMFDYNLSSKEDMS